MSNLNYRQSARFLDRATFGVHPDEVEALEQSGISAWLYDQFSIEPSSHWTQVRKKTTGKVYFVQRQGAWLDLAVWGPDQLRQRVAFALSQTLVASSKHPTFTSKHDIIIKFYDIFVKHAFGNYRDLLREITISPVMGTYLTMVDNRSEAASGSLPDENYAREVMQLFTIGLNKLTQGGEEVLGGDGLPIPNYDDDDISNLARVFTGWRLDSKSLTDPMVVKESDHDDQEKIILGTHFPAGVGAEEELDQVLDVFMEHGNIAPFICKGLISKLVTSNPAPEYVARVATVFTATGGNLMAVVEAIYSDSALLEEDSDYMAGVREPILLVTAFLRTLNAFPGDSDVGFEAPKSFYDAYGQNVMSAPSVFGFFDVDYSPLGAIADQGLLAPKLDGYDWIKLVTTSNLFYKHIWDQSDYVSNPKGKSKVYVVISDFVETAETLGRDAVIEMIGRRFLHDKVPPAIRSALTAIFDDMTGGSVRNTVRQMIYVTVTSSKFRVQE